MITCRLISADEYVDRSISGRRAGKRLAYFDPGLMWLCPWLYDPTDPDMEQYLPGLMRHPAKSVPTAAVALSRNYFRNWARLRPPLQIVLPNRFVWCPDSISTTGNVWLVTGNAPTISVSPGVICRDYEGSLVEGTFIETKRVKQE